MTAKVSAPARRVRRPGDASVIEMLLVTGLLIAAIIYAITAFSTRNATWFLPNDFSASRPRMIYIYHEGERHALAPGNGGYERLTAALNEQLANIEAFYEYGMGDEALANAYDQYTTVVLLYEEPLQIRTHWNLGEPNEILIPITGTNAYSNKVFTGTDGRYGHGGLVLGDMSEFYETVRDLGYDE